jgi:hypothetical protein
MSKSTVFAFMLAFLTLFSVLSAQTTTVDFETVGTDWTWTIAENGSNPAMTFPANPYSGGINTSAHVAQFTALASGAAWALTFTDNIEPFQFDATNKIVTIQVYKTVTSDVAIKFEGSSPAVELHVANTLVNQWQTLTFDFSGYVGNTYSRLVIIPDFAARSEDHTILMDNIVIPDGNITVVEPEAPTVAAPVPTTPSANVISVFSDSYTNLAGINYAPNWGQTTTVTTMDIDGNNMLRYTNFNYQGTQFASGTNLSAMTYVHVDMWTPDATVVMFGPISLSTGGYVVSLTPLNQNAWNSYDIPLTSFPGVSFTDIHQLKFDCIPGHYPSTVYIDNVYFYSNAPATNDASLSDLKVDGTTVTGFAAGTLTYNVVLPTGTTTVPTVTATTTNASATYVVNNAASLPGSTTVVVTSADGSTNRTYTLNFTIMPAGPTTAAPTPTRPAANVISIFSDAYTSLTGTDFAPNWGQTTVVSNETISGNNTLKYSNFNYQGTQFAAAQNLSAMTYVHVDMWTSDATMVLFGPISITSGGALTFLTPINAGSWGSYDIPLTSFPGVTWTDVHQLKFDCTPGHFPSTIYIDNVYFYNDSAPANDASLSDLKVNGTTVAGFAANDYSYDVYLASSVTTVPTVTATPANPSATVLITAATAIPGTTTVLVTSADASTTQTYSVNFAYLADAPTVSAATPTHAAEDVVSIYSDIYTNMAGTNFMPNWGQSTAVTFPTIGADNLIKYANFNYQGTQFASATSFSLMEYIHIDMWTADATVVLFSPISASSGEHLVSLTPLSQGSWNSYDIPLTNFTGVSMNDIHQLKFDGQTGVNPSNIYLDNIYFWKNPAAAGSDATLSDLKVDGTTVTGFTGSVLSYTVELPNGTTTVPTVTATTNDAAASFVVHNAAALPGTTTVVVTAENGTTSITYSVVFSLAPAVPTVGAVSPTTPSDYVISLFSNEYSNVPIDTWSAVWDQADVADYSISGNATKKYTNLTYAGIEFTSSPINAADMTRFHMDVWTPDNTDSPSVFKVKLVDFGANGVWSGGDDVEHELTFGPDVMNTASWVAIDVPLSDFTNLTTRGHLAQMIISGSPRTLYVDNVYLYSDAVLNAPQNITVAATAGNVTVSWAAVSGATSYVVYASDLPYSGFTAVSGGTYTGTSWTGAVSGNMKFYRVTAVR